MLRRTAAVAAAAVAAAALIALAGCSSDADGDATVEATDAPTPTTTMQAPDTATSDPEAELRAAVTAYSDAYLGGDGAAAWAILSNRCQARVSQSDMDTATSLAASTYGAQPITSLDVTVSGDMARATYTYADGTLDQMGEPWTLEDGRWRQDDC
jgi:hypothetical protein